MARKQSKYKIMKDKVWVSLLLARSDLAPG